MRTREHQITAEHAAALFQIAFELEAWKRDDDFHHDERDKETEAHR